MNAAFVLLRYSIRKVRGPVIALWSLLFGLQLLMAAIARTFEVSGQFSEMARFIPEFIRPLLDPSFMAALSFSGMVCFGYTHVIVILLLVAQCIAVATELTDEVETKFIDLLASRPIPRSILVVRSTAVILFLTLSAVSIMVLGSFSGLFLFAPDSVDWPPTNVILSLAANLSLLAIAWGGITTAIAAVAKRRAAAASAAGLLAFATFVIDFAGRLWEPIDMLAVVSPFRYYVPFQLIAGSSLESSDVVVLLGIFVSAIAVAIVAYSSRDL